MSRKAKEGHARDIRDVVVTVRHVSVFLRDHALHASKLGVEVEVAFLQFVFHISEYGEKRAAHKFFFDYFFGQFSCQVIFFMQLARNFFSFFCLTKFDRARPGYPPVKSFFIFFSIFFSRLFGAACQTSRLFSLAFATDFFSCECARTTHSLRNEIKSPFGWLGCENKQGRSFRMVDRYSLPCASAPSWAR